MLGTWEPRQGGSPCVWGQPELQSKALSQKNKKKKICGFLIFDPVRFLMIALDRLLFVLFCFLLDFNSYRIISMDTFVAVISHQALIFLVLGGLLLSCLWYIGLVQRP